MSPNLIRTTFATAFGALLAMPMLAHATVLTTTTDVVNFKKSHFVTDTLGANKTVSDGKTELLDYNLGTTQVARFSAATGVLTGVTVNLKSTHQQVTDVTAPATTNGSNSGNASATGSGSSTVKLVVPGQTTNGASVATQADACGAKPKEGCSNGASQVKPEYNLPIGAASLNDYAGSGTFSAQHVATKLSAETSANGFNSTATTTSTVNWDGSLSATYTYLQHAAQSFDGTSFLDTLTVDFGDIFLGDSVADKNFSIFNLAGERVGLQLTGIAQSGDSQFSTTLNTFGNLGAGMSHLFSASFLANTLGSFGAEYRLTLADVAPEGSYASNTLGTGYGLTLKFTGNVIARPADNDVPEPATLMLLGLGAAALGASRKRRA